MTQKIDPKLIKIDAGTEGQALVISNGELSFGSVAAGGGSSSISVSETAPTEPSEGDLWFDSSTSNIYVYYDGYWIEPSFKVTVAASDDYNDLTNTPALSAVATSGNYTDLTNTPTLATVATTGNYSDLSNTPQAGGVTVYTNFADLPVSGNTAGDQAFVSSTRTLYLWDGQGWFGVALINQTPTISGNASSYVVSEGVSIDVTMIASDPEGDPITWSSELTGDDTITVTNTGNVFTIANKTPFTGGSGTIIFKANDGYNLATAVSEFQMELPDLAYFSTKNTTPTEPTWSANGDAVWLYTADNYTLTLGVPATVDIDVWGGGGGAGASWSNSTQKGGSGGYFYARDLELPAGEYTLVVGAGGRGGIYNATELQADMDANNEDFGNGGLGTQGGYSGAGNNNGGCGGGFSGLFLGSPSQSSAIIMAGGGGGGAGSSNYDGGSGGGSEGADGEGNAGSGGTQTEGGLAEHGADPGTALQGGDGVAATSGFGGGGGGGGYFGGGASGVNGSSGSGAGGGGSGYINSSYTFTSYGSDTSSIRQDPVTAPSSISGAPTEVANSASAGTTSTSRTTVDGKDGAVKLTLRALS